MLYKLDNTDSAGKVKSSPWEKLAHEIHYKDMNGLN